MNIISGPAKFGLQRFQCKQCGTTFEATDDEYRVRNEYRYVPIRKPCRSCGT
jgi:RNase P subunit RPR2